jgi:hypothetical protein
MAMNKHLICGVHVTNRVQHAAAVQQLLTEYGCSIKTRLGMHEAGDGSCSPNGLILLEMIGETDEARAMASKLNALEGVEVQEMLFDHP